MLLPHSLTCGFKLNLELACRYVSAVQKMRSDVEGQFRARDWSLQITWQFLILDVSSVTAEDGEMCGKC